jgi:DUF4097 and DUF4098 domain-containing protein YvlB
MQPSETSDPARFREDDMRNRQTLLTIVAVATVALLLGGQSALGGEKVRETFSKSYPLVETGRVSLENINGDVQINVWDKAEVKIEAIKEASSREYLDGLEIDVRTSANSVRIDTIYPQNRGERGLFNWGNHDHGQVTYTITVPRQAELDSIELINGELEISGVVGGIKAQTINGTLRVRGVSGSVALETVNGEVNVSFDKLTSKDRISIDSVNGRIELSAGAEVRAETVNGHLSNEFGVEVEKHRWVGAEMNGVIGGGGATIELETVNGTIAVRKL